MSCTRCQSFVLRAVLKNSSVIIMGNMITFQLFSQLIFAVQKKMCAKKQNAKRVAVVQFLSGMLIIHGFITIFYYQILV